MLLNHDSIIGGLTERYVSIMTQSQVDGANVMAQWGVNHGEMGHTLSLNEGSIAQRWTERYGSMEGQS